MKEKATELLKEKLILRDEHYLGAVLFPNTRNLLHSDEQEREHARSLILSRMRDISPSEGKKITGKNMYRYIHIVIF